MSSPDPGSARTGQGGRRRLLTGLVWLASLLPLAGCNLRPLYGGLGGEAVSAELAAVEISTDQNETAQYLRNRLEDDLNPDGLRVEPGYELLVELERSSSALAIQLDSTITRYDLYVLASFSLRPLGQAQPILTSAVRRVASYDVERQPYATLVAQQNAERRALVEVSREIRMRLALFFARNGAT